MSYFQRQKPLAFFSVGQPTVFLSAVFLSSVFLFAACVLSNCSFALADTKVNKAWHPRQLPAQKVQLENKSDGEPARAQLSQKYAKNINQSEDKSLKESPRRKVPVIRSGSLRAIARR